MSQANCVKRKKSREPAFLGQDDLKMLLFGGKGGVGKTTCAAAAALHLANSFPQHRFMVVSTDPAHSLKDAFSGFSPPPNLELLEIDSKECFEKFKQTSSCSRTSCIILPRPCAGKTLRRSLWPVRFQGCH